MDQPDIQLEVRNRQRKWPLNVNLVREIGTWVAEALFENQSAEISVQFLPSTRMAEVNQDFLQHEGATDVITFDLSEEAMPDFLIGEILVCPEVASKQSVEFGTQWHEESIRYVIHGLLHLKGFDDLKPEKRKVMKRHENKWMTKVAERFDLDDLIQR
jgi:probable rRNA maturation factor